MLLWTPAASELQEVCVYAVLSVQAPFRLEKLVLFATFVCNLWLILRVLIRDGLFFNVTKLSARSTSEIGTPLCTNLLRLSCTPRTSSLRRLLQGCRACSYSSNGISWPSRKVQLKLIGAPSRQVGLSPTSVKQKIYHTRTYYVATSVYFCPAIPPFISKYTIPTYSLLYANLPHPYLNIPYLSIHTYRQTVRTSVY